MTTGATGQLGLALPVQGELSGTWGDTVNNGITQYTNIAIAGTLTLTGDGAVNLQNTTGDASASNIVSSLTGAGTVTAQFAIVRVTGTLTTPKIITAPSYSKTYVVVNAATGSTVSFIRSGQTPAVSIAVGESAFVYYNGTDYVKVSSTVATGVTSFQTSLSGLTPSTSTTGAVTLAGTLGTANGGTNLTSFTSGGVVYASSSSALATGSALTFDGSKLGLGITPGANILFTLRTATQTDAAFVADNGVNTGFRVQFAANLTSIGNDFNQPLAFLQNNTEQMRLTSTGLGIGTSSPTRQLSVVDSSNTTDYQLRLGQAANSGNNSYDIGRNTSSTGYLTFYGNQSGGNGYSFGGVNGTRMVIDTSGNVGIGTTSPSNRVSIVTASGSDGIVSVKSPTTDTAGILIDGGSTSNKGALLTLAKDGTTKWRIGLDSAIGGGTNNNLNILGSSTDALLFGTNATERARIDSSGRLIIQNGPVSTSTSAVKGVQIYFDATNNQGYIYSTESGVANYPLNINASTMALGSTVTTFIISGTERARMQAGFSVGTTADPGAGAIYATGNITAYYSSDIKFKENVRDIPDALATVNAIGGKLFDWTDEYIESKGGADGYFVQKADFGVVAQDVQKVFPIAVRTREDGSLAVDYEKLGALAFAALVELTKRVEALESK